MQNDWQRKQILLLALLGVATVAVYWQLAHCGFLNYDDSDYVSENRIVQKGLGWEGISWAFTNRYAWHPLTWLSHMLDCQWFGLNPRAHHLVNLVFHLVNVLLLFKVLTNMTGATERSAFVAALFAWHPLHVESVAWIAERKDVLSTCFSLLTLWTYSRYAQSRRKAPWALMILFFALGLAAKPMLVTLPCLMLLLDFWPLRRWQVFGASPWAASVAGRPLQPERAGRLLLEKIPLFLLAAAVGVVTLIYYENWPRAAILDPLPFSLRLANAAVSSLRYIAKMFWPQNLSVIYPHPGVWPEWQVAGAGLLLISLTIIFLLAARDYPFLLTGWLWFLVTLAPVSGLIQVNPQAMADRYTYFPLVGLFISVTWGFAGLVARWRYRRIIQATVGALVLLGCLWTCRGQVAYWKDSETLFRHAVAVTTNNALAHYNLAQALSMQGNLKEPLPHYNETLRLLPNFDSAHNNAGLTLFRLGDFRGATNHYALALQFNPKNELAHLNFGIALASIGDMAGAVPHYEEALRLDPNNPIAHSQLGLALAAQGKTKEAVWHYRQALQLDPALVEALNNLAWLLATHPNAEYRNGTEAVRLAQRACELTAYKIPTLVGTLGAAYAEAGGFEEAARAAQQAHDLAAAAGQKEIAATNERLRQLYRSKQAFRESSP